MTYHLRWDDKTAVAADHLISFPLPPESTDQPAYPLATDQIFHKEWRSISCCVREEASATLLLIAFHLNYSLLKCQIDLWGNGGKANG